MTSTIEIITEYGTSTLRWDDSTGWMLRYHLVGPDAEDALGRRDLVEALHCDAGPDDADAALRHALCFLGKLGVGAGEQLTSAGAAKVADGLNSAASWRAASWRPEPDGGWDRRTPWWWTSTVLAAQAARPGRGRRTDLRPTYAANALTVRDVRRITMADRSATIGMVAGVLAQHRVDVYGGSSRWHWACICGWTSPAFTLASYSKERNAAEQAARYHVAKQVVRLLGEETS